MIDEFVQGKNPTCFIWLGVGNLSNFAVVKNLSKFGGCLADNNTFYFWKQVLSSLFLI